MIIVKLAKVIPNIVPVVVNHFYITINAYKTVHYEHIKIIQLVFNVNHNANTVINKNV